MAKRRWHELSPRTRRLILVAGVVDGVLKAAALADLARRPASDVRGSKTRWALAVSLTNSVGFVPVVYFIYGRRGSGPTT